jgi:hypothetical protein
MPGGKTSGELFVETGPGPVTALSATTVALKNRNDVNRCGLAADDIGSDFPADRTP